MKKQKDIYCDLGFWQHLSGLLSSAKMSPDPVECKKIQTLLEWYSLLCRSNLYFDCSIDDFENAAKDDLYLQVIRRNYPDKRCELAFSNGSINKMCSGPSQMDLGMYSSLFLSKTNHQEEAKKVGVICICSNELFDHDELFCDKGPSIQQQENTNWKSILGSNLIPHNCNSMVIVDNYIFDKVDNNLYKVLDALLPSKLDTTFYLTVFSINDGNETYFDNKRLSLESKLKDIRPELHVSLEIFENRSNDFHDRSIITNYMWVGIGAGFNIINRHKADKSTELHVVYPMIVSEDRINWGSERYQILIDDAKKCLRNHNKHSNNRLLR